jgi:hypothetical protein
MIGPLSPSRPCRWASTEAPAPGRSGATNESVCAGARRRRATLIPPNVGRSWSLVHRVGASNE